VTAAGRPFIHDRFLLESDVAAELYEGCARDLPIVDYHAHLPPAQMAENHRFRSITELWLEGDHYKWRAMRTAGVPERCCSGDAPDREKFEAWARTVPDTLRNPLYHWTHMELKRPFGIEELLGPDNAGRVYDRCNERLGEPGFSAMGLLEGFSVAVSCTTDDPADSLEHHEKLARRVDPATRVVPTWRPDAAFAVSDPREWNAWVARLEAVAGAEVRYLDSLLEVLDARHRAFAALGCRASDHGLETLPAEPWADSEVAASFDALRAGKTLEPGPAARLQSALVHRLALMDHERGWVQQFHLGALRDVNRRLFESIGQAAGGDSMADSPQAASLGRFLDRLDREGALARTILYNLNPADNELMATMVGNFQDGSSPCRMQYGPAWWFLDQLDGMQAQLGALSNMGLLAHFVGMVTDSRSFLSFSRHDYFRRLLCNMLGEDVRRGLVPDDRELLGRLVTRVCYTNALEYFGFGGEGGAGVRAD
jgi:glucuronate isomerase